MPTPTIPTRPGANFGMGRYLGTQEMENDNVQDAVAAVAAGDSKLNQLAATEGLKMANRRGLVNSSMGVGAAQDSVLKQAVAIGGQEAAQNASANAQRRGFEYGMESQAVANEFTSRQAALDRTLQRTVASWNLRSADRNAAAQFVTNMEEMYQRQYATIMNNTNLTSKTRTSYLKSAKALRDKQLNMVEQMYNVDLRW